MGKMINQLRLLAFFSILFTYLGCNNAKLVEPISPQLTRQWMVVEFQNFSKEELMKNKASIDLSQLNESKQDVALMGCNIIILKKELKSNYRIQFSEGAHTKMFCQEAMPLENAFLEVLPNINAYKIEGHFLSLYNNDDLIMKLVAADWD